MRMSEPIAERREWVEHVIRRERTGHALTEQPMHRGDAARHVELAITPHQEHVGRRQHRHGDAGIRQTPADLGKTGMIDRGKLRDVTDRHAAAPAMGVGLAAHLVEVHPRWVEVEIQVKIDVEIETVCEAEDARDLPVRVGVGIGATADHVGT
jgi:hypothetical protein